MDRTDAVWLSAAPPPGHAGRGRSGAGGSSPRARRRTGRVIGGLLAVVILLGGGWVWLNDRFGSITLMPTCAATALDNTARFTPEQASNAAVIASIADRRGLPARAATIGIATAIQESKLINIDYGDRDSLGLFQQRPSQGWGTPDQIMNPVYATNAFYDVLVKVEGYQNLPITQAAQRVQRSAFPTAYADHEPEARVFASALSGHSQAALTCTLRPAQDLPVQQPGENGLTPRAQAVVDAALVETAAKRPAALSLPETAAGTVVTFNTADGDTQRRSWAVAQWAVARAQALNIEAVAVDGRRWSRDQPQWVEWSGDAQATPGQVTVSVSPGA